MTKLTIKDVRKYQNKMKEINTIGEYKTLGRELQQEFNLTVPQVNAILNNRVDEILSLLEMEEI